MKMNGKIIQNNVLKINSGMGGNHDFDFLENQNHFFGNQNDNQNRLNFGNQNQNHRRIDDWKSMKIKIIFGSQNQNRGILDMEISQNQNHFGKSKSKSW